MERPDVVLSAGSDGASGHLDHIAVGRATTEAFLGFADGDRPHPEDSLGPCGVVRHVSLVCVLSVPRRCPDGPRGTRLPCHGVYWTGYRPPPTMEVEGGRLLVICLASGAGQTAPEVHQDRSGHRRFRGTALEGGPGSRWPLDAGRASPR
jgi:hypothetical protein